jgi:hypothetical protein
MMASKKAIDRGNAYIMWRLRRVSLINMVIFPLFSGSHLIDQLLGSSNSNKNLLSTELLFGFICLCSVSFYHLAKYTKKTDTTAKQYKAALWFSVTFFASLSGFFVIGANK